MGKKGETMQWNGLFETPERELAVACWRDMQFQGKLVGIDLVITYLVTASSTAVENRS